MAAVTTTALHISHMFPQHAEVFPVKLGVDFTAGEIGYFDSAGKLVKSSAAGAGTAKVAGMVLRSGRAGQTVDLLKEGHVEGVNVAAMAYGAKVYLADAAGGLADLANTVSVVVGSVVPTSEQGTPKVLYFVANWLAL